MLTQKNAVLQGASNKVSNLQRESLQEENLCKEHIPVLLTTSMNGNKWLDVASFGKVKAHILLQRHTEAALIMPWESLNGAGNLRGLATCWQIQ